MFSGCFSGREVGGEGYIGGSFHGGKDSWGEEFFMKGVPDFSALFNERSETE